MDHDCGNVPESDFIYFDEDGRYWIGIDGERIAVGPIQFCPYCGNELKADPNEVRMLKEKIKRQNEERQEEERMAIKEIYEIIDKNKREK